MDDGWHCIGRHAFGIMVEMYTVAAVQKYRGHVVADTLSLLCMLRLDTCIVTTCYYIQLQVNFLSSSNNCSINSSAESRAEEGWRWWRAMCLCMCVHSVNTANTIIMRFGGDRSWWRTWSTSSSPSVVPSLWDCVRQAACYARNSLIEVQQRPPVDIIIICTK